MSASEGRLPPESPRADVARAEPAQSAAVNVCGPECDGERHECDACAAEGYVLGDCFEDTCPCANPEQDHDMVECMHCGGKGGWPCPNVTAP